MKGAIDAFGKYQRPVFSLDVSKHNMKITNLWNRICKRIMKIKITLCTFRCIVKASDGVLFECEITSLKKKYVTSEGAVSHNVVYYQQLSMAYFTSQFLC